MTLYFLTLGVRLEVHTYNYGYIASLALEYMRYCNLKLIQITIY